MGLFGLMVLRQGSEGRNPVRAGRTAKKENGQETPDKAEGPREAGRKPGSILSAEVNKLDI